MKNLSTDNDFAKTNLSQVSGIYSLKENLLDFDVLLSAPDFKPLNEPISIFRTMDDGPELCEVERGQKAFGQDCRDRLKDVIKKYMAEEEKPEETVPETEPEKIPDIGKERVNARIVQGGLPNDQVGLHELVEYCLFQEDGGKDRK